MKKFQSYTSQLCDLSPSNLLEILKKRSRLQTEWMEDWQWYQQMCLESQPGVLAGRDKVMEKRMKAKDKRHSRQQSRESESHDSSRTEVWSSLDSADDGQSDSEWIGGKRKRKARKRNLPDELSATHDRLQMSFRQRAMASAHVISATGGDISSVSLSKSSLHRQAKKARVEKSAAQKEEFVLPSHPVIHFDTKLVAPKGKDPEERGAILVSGGDELPQPKLLGIPKLRSSSGADVADAVLEQLAKDKVSPSSLTGIVYDTTASNTGWKSGATWRLEREVGHAVLGLECRRHVQERHISHAATAVFGATKGPTKTLYKKFRKSWSKLD